MTPAERQRRHRRNSRLGRICITLAVDVSVVQALVESGLLAVADCDDRAAIGAALEKATIEIKNCHSVTKWRRETMGLYDR
jgi:hypothetical protein